MYGKVSMGEVEIEAGQTESSAIDLREVGQLAALILPAEMTGNQFTFKASMALEGDYNTLYSDGADYTVPVAAGKYVVIDPTIFHGVIFLKLTSSTAEAADRKIIVVGREF